MMEEEFDLPFAGIPSYTKSGITNFSHNLNLHFVIHSDHNQNLDVIIVGIQVS